MSGSGQAIVRLRSAAAGEGLPGSVGDLLESSGLTHERLVRLAYRVCWNSSDAEDAVQSALLIAIERPPSRDSNLGAWLKTLVLRQCIELNRRGERRGRLAAGAADRATRPRAHDPVELSDEAAAMRRLIARLPERPRLALVLRHLEGCEYAEIAALLEVAESTARGLVHEARERLREWMTGGVEGGAR